MINLSEVNILDILPQSLSNDKDVAALAIAVDVELKKINSDILKTNIFGALECLPDRILDELGWQEHIDFYSTELPRDIKIKLIKNSAQAHKYKGTAWAIEQSIQDIYGNSRLEEWFEYGGEPYSFKVLVELEKEGISEEKQILIEKVINTYKNSRSFLEEVKIVLNGRCKTHGNSVLATGELTTVYPWGYTVVPMSVSKSYMEAGMQNTEVVSVYPKEG